MKREEIKKRPLSDATRSALEPTGKLYREKDSQGLYFVVNDKGGKSRQVRYKNAAGKWTFTGIGSYPGRGQQGKPASDTIFIMALRRLGYEDRHTHHGFRHVASTMLREQGYPRDHVEAALAHITLGVEGVYNKAGYLEQRRTMMQAWADHLDTIRDPKVIQFTKPASA